MVLGVTLGAALAGDPVNVAVSGEVTEPSWAWAEDMQIFLGVDGALTQTIPTSGALLVVGVATAPTTILVGVKFPIILQG